MKEKISRSGFLKLAAATVSSTPLLVEQLTRPSQEVTPSIFYGEEATVEQAASDAWLEMSDTWKHCSATVVGTNGCYRYPLYEKRKW